MNITIRLTKVEFEILMALNKRNKKYKKVEELKVKEGINIDRSARITPYTNKLDLCAFLVLMN